jgi:hypothetical protein
MPIHIAAVKGHIEIVDFLIGSTNGTANIDMKDKVARKVLEQEACTDSTSLIMIAVAMLISLRYSL